MNLIPGVASSNLFAHSCSIISVGNNTVNIMQQLRMSDLLCKCYRLKFLILWCARRGRTNSDSGHSYKLISVATSQWNSPLLRRACTYMCLDVFILNKALTQDVSRTSVPSMVTTRHTYRTSLSLSNFWTPLYIANHISKPVCRDFTIHACEH